MSLHRLPIAAFAALSTWAGGAAAADEALPPGMVFFVTGTTCPEGSGAVPQAVGRLLLATTNPAQAGKARGAPLGVMEDRTHQHAGKVTLELGTHQISGASGGGNGQATEKGKHTADITSGPATSGLPFIQLLVCEAKKGGAS